MAKRKQQINYNSTKTVFITNAQRQFPVRQAYAKRFALLATDRQREIPVAERKNQKTRQQQSVVKRNIIEATELEKES